MSVTQTTKRSILVVDNEKNYRIVLSRILEGAGYLVLSAEGPQSALELLCEQPVALIMTDLHRPEADGLELCRCVSRDIGKIPFILFAACFTARQRQEIDAIVESWAGLCKPFNNGDVLSLVEAVLAASSNGQNYKQGAMPKRIAAHNSPPCAKEQETA